MKIEVLSGEKTDFEPVQLNITIESEEELISLWLKLNISVNGIFDHYNRLGGHYDKIMNRFMLADTYELRKTLYDICKSRRLIEQIKETKEK